MDIFLYNLNNYFWEDGWLRGKQFSLPWFHILPGLANLPMLSPKYSHIILNIICPVKNVQLFFLIHSKQLKNHMYSIIKVYVLNSNKLFSFAWTYFTSTRDKICIVNFIYLYWHLLSKEATKFIHVTQLIRCLLDISETPFSGASLSIILYYTSH